ncbi:MAG TPA: DNA replication and repair protein RecF [Candidatus Tectomicrobia bacterium]|nr:DNA replication and repair protein RecF [Candidatus Tectomicrobia bacterium]
MRLMTIQARNFRNFDRLELGCGPRLNILIGDNGQGKTNLLESIYVLGQLRSFRGVGRTELTRWGADVVNLQGTVEHPARASTVTLGMSWHSQRRVLKVQGREIQRAVDYLGHLNALVFAADSVQVIKGTPEGRRRLLDRALVSLQPSYLGLLQRHQIILKHRNRLLKEPKIDRASLDVWNAKFGEVGAEVVRARARYLRRLNHLLRSLSASKLGSPTALRLQYRPALGAAVDDPDALTNGGDDLAETVQCLAAGIARVEREELRARMSLIGPQRDDLSFYLEGRDLKNYGSQGEQRLAVLLVLIGMLEDLADELGTPPVVLLDDMVAELDRRRRGLLWEFLQNIRAQVFISGTELTADLEALCAAVPETQVWRVEAGTIVANA